MLGWWPRRSFTSSPSRRSRFRRLRRRPRRRSRNPPLRALTNPLPAPGRGLNGLPHAGPTLSDQGRLGMKKAITGLLTVVLVGVLAAVVVAAVDTSGSSSRGGATTAEDTTGTTVTTEDRTTTAEDRTTTTEDRIHERGEDISGPCDEAEHANDPRCDGRRGAEHRRRCSAARRGHVRARATRLSTPTTRAAPAPAPRGPLGARARRPGRRPRTRRRRRRRPLRRRPLRPRPRWRRRAAATTTAPATVAETTTRAATAAAAPVDPSRSDVHRAGGDHDGRPRRVRPAAGSALASGRCPQQGRPS